MIYVINRFERYAVARYKKLYGKGEIVLYKPNMPKEQAMLANACGVTVKDCGSPSSYAQYYEDVFRELKESILELGE